MLNLQYIGEKSLYQVDFKYLSENLVQIIGNAPIKTKGFVLTRIGNADSFTGDYSAFTTVYRTVDGGAQFSNDGTVYVEPVPKVSFYTNGGGTLDGQTTQEVNDYSELVIPDPIAHTDYEFTQWSPEIPASGEVDSNKSFTAIFVSTAPIPEPEPSLEDRVVVVEKDIQRINEALGGK